MTGQRQQHVDRARLLAEIGAALATSVEPAAIITALVGAVGRDYATSCELEGCVALGGPFDDASFSQVGRGRATLYAALSRATCAGEEKVRADALVARGMVSAIVVDFSVNGRSNGALVFARDEGRVAYGAADQSTAEEITVRLTAALEHAALLAMARQERGRAEAANQLRDDFLATLSHELRTPLSAILGWTQLLRAGGLPPDQQAKALATIERNTRSQAALIEDMLDISRIVTGKMRLEITKVSLPGVVAAAVDTVRPAAVAKGVHLDIEAMGSENWVRGDSDRLHQVLWNVLSNAVKFTPNGGRVTVRSRRDDSTIEIEIADTGSGIAPAFLPHVFERFRQADPSKTRTHSGLGLGLAISRQLVELHGGAIRAESPGVGRGTTFTLRLPVQGPDAPVALVADLPSTPTPASEAASTSDVATLRVLIVDDDPDTLELLRMLFELNGSDVTIATSAAEAFSALSAAPPDILISDIGMPHETGYDLIRKVRALPAAQGGATVAIALTAYARSSDIAEALGSGFDRHLAKPVEPTQLLAMVASLARRRAV